MRMIIRFSINRERNGALRNKLANLLKVAGFVLGQNTATWETTSTNPAALSVVLNEFWDVVARHKGPGVIDHFWCYTDV